ncbi:MAG: SpoIID/LytB domain-containing protein [Oscillospiraceae bacterium]|nr:SpoIID/LytB domain-containing protein [Oscillospiraceae bacterium]
MAQGVEPVIRVGLAYGEGSLAVANLQNLDGYGIGYRLGYFSDIGEFFELARTSSYKISMRAGNNSSTIVVSDTDTGAYIFEFEGNLAILPSLGEVPRPVTWFRGFHYAGGFEYRRRGNNVTVINVVGMEDYVKGVVPYEIGGGVHIEAQKAQALCARSYAHSNRRKHSTFGFDVCATIDCQVYQGTKFETDSSNAAVEMTRGQYVFWSDNVAQTYYHSSNGGSTEDVTNIWVTDLPYLRAVRDNFEDLSTSSNGRWTYTLTNEMLTYILNGKGHENSGIISMTAEYTAAGNILALNFTDSSGKTFRFEKERARSILSSATYDVSIYSQRFTVNTGQMVSLESSSGVTVRSDLENITILGAWGQTANVSLSTGILGGDGTISPIPQAQSNGTYVITGTGWGHNVGMSQNGAKAMANLGYTYVDIIQYYFRDVYVGYL